METFEGKANVKTVNGQAPDSGGNVNVKEYSHPDSGVTAGTYRKVTVNAQGHVTKGENPILAISEGGTGATIAKQARTNLGIGIDVSLSEATVLWENPSQNDGLDSGLKTLSQPYTNFKKLLIFAKTMSGGYSYYGSSVVDVDVLTKLLADCKTNGWPYAQLAYICGAGVYLSVAETTATQFYYSNNSGARWLALYGYK